MPAQRATTKDYYELLEVPRDASGKLIKRAYRRLAKKCHPDLHPGDRTSAARFRDLHEAYETLFNHDMRVQYDNTLPRQEPSSDARGATQRPRPQGARPAEGAGSGTGRQTRHRDARAGAGPGPGKGRQTQSRGARPVQGEVLENLLGMKLAWIPPGSFLMGSRDDEFGRAAGEGPPHRVLLKRGFWMGSTTVTQAEWYAVFGATPLGPWAAHRPVTRVSWEDCQEFCRRLTRLEREKGRLPRGLVYRLPTEAEWEYACRAGTIGARYGEVDSVAWHNQNSGAEPHEVGQKRANDWGLYDMLGNVFEWCHDGKRSYSATAQTDPFGPIKGKRALRGGSWHYEAKYCRAASRVNSDPDQRCDLYGCRVVVGAPVEPHPQPKKPDDSSFDNVVISAIGLKIVWISPGTFHMGSPGDERDREDDEVPMHPVQLTRGFLIGQTEVTQAQWMKLMGSNPSHFKGSLRPVERVSWHDCQEFCGKLTQLERSKGTLPPGFEYRLPTEAEWEYACRAGTTGVRYGEVGSVAWHRQNSGAETHEVGRRRANAWGLLDMLGNVFEWCQDGMRPYSAESQVDPVGPSGGALGLRGGSWDRPVKDCRAATRFANDPLTRTSNIGFRVVLGAPAKAE